jgi:flagellar hook-length control protein FliK
MNPMIVKIISSLISGQTNNSSRATASDSGNDKLFAGILNSLRTAQKNPASEASSPLKAGRSNGHRHQLYIEAFQKALLAQGKPLNQVSLKGEDLPLMNKFLRHCGFSQKDVNRFLNELAADSPGREINLSRFFQRITELSLRRNKDRSSSFLEPSAVPHMEGVLRKLGLKPRELERVFGAAKVAGGRLDLDKLVAKLKQISRPAKGEAHASTVQKLDPQLADTLKMMGIHIPEKGKSGRISLQDFIASLEQKTGRPDVTPELPADVTPKLPAEVQTTVDQLLSKVVVSGEKLVSNSKLTDIHIKAKIENGGKPAAENILHAPFRPEDKTVDEKSRLSSLKKRGRSLENGRLSTFSTGEDKTNTENKQAKIAATSPVQKLEFASKLKGSPGLKQGIKEDIADFKSEIKAVNTSQQMPGATLTEAIRTAAQGEKPSQDFLPTYLVDQVGRQLSRALLKGDRVIRLRLKPPELGAVKIEMDMKDNVLRLAMIAENSQVKEILLSNVHELRDALMDQGVKIEELDVQVNHDFNQSPASSEEGLKERQRLIQEQGRGPLAAENNMDDSVPEPRGRASSDGLLNLVA